MKSDKSGNLSRDNPQGSESRTSSLAILAFALSLASILLVFSGIVPYLVAHRVVPHSIVPYMPIPAVVFGCIALIAIRRSQGRLRGRAMAVTGIVLSSIWLTFLLVFVPMLRGIEREAFEVKQRAQLKSIDTALELFKAEFGYYPPSDALDDDGKPYCGAMKLCEAVMGQDLMGIHPDSIFRSDGTDGKGAMLYLDANDLSKLSKGVYWHDLSVRKGPYLPIEIVNAYRLGDICEDAGPFDGNEYVLCDVFKKLRGIESGKEVDMPILYYKADTSKTAHDVDDPNNSENIYDYKDNHALLALGVPGKPSQKHPLFANSKIFYEMTRDYKVAGMSKPNNADTFILLSAGWDGLYGTKDDIANFEMRWKPK